MTDLVSIIIPIYRVEEYLKKAVDSVLNQTYKNIEVILIDDGSDDCCPQICDDYAKNDSRVKVIHKENGGLDEARKTGVLEATGKYIGYVDSDDWIEPDMYEKLVYYINTYEVDVVESGIIDSWGDVETNRLPHFERGCYKYEKFNEIIGPKVLYSGKFFKYGVSPYFCTKLFKRELITEFQMMPDPSENVVDDIMCTLPCIAYSKSLYVTDECFYHYRVRLTSLKRKIRNDFLEKISMCYTTWIDRFKETSSEFNMEEQIEFFAMYLLLLKAPWVFDDQNSSKYLFAFGEICKSKKVVLYGAGQSGVFLENYIRNINQENLVLWTDKNYQNLDKLMNVKSPKLILESEYDYVIISILTESAVNSAKNDLIALGIQEEKILWIEREYLENPSKLLSRVL